MGDWADQALPRDHPMRQSHMPKTRSIPYEELNSAITRAIDTSPCDYQDVIEILQNQLEFIYAAREQEHGEPVPGPTGNICGECSHRQSSHFECHLGSFCKECPVDEHIWEHTFKEGTNG